MKNNKLRFDDEDMTEHRAIESRFIKAGNMAALSEFWGEKRREMLEQARRLNLRKKDLMKEVQP